MVVEPHRPPRPPWRMRRCGHVAADHGDRRVNTAELTIFLCQFQRHACTVDRRVDGGAISFGAVNLSV